MMGAFFSTAIAVMVSSWATPTAAIGIGTVLGLGGAGMLGAANIPPPHAERVGLRDCRAAASCCRVLLLLPIAILASEMDNVVSALLPGARRAAGRAEQTIEKLPATRRLSRSKRVIVAVGLFPSSKSGSSAA